MPIGLLSANTDSGTMDGVHQMPCYSLCWWQKALWTDRDKRSQFCAALPLPLPKDGYLRMSMFETYTEWPFRSALAPEMCLMRGAGFRNPKHAACPISSVSVF